MLSGRGLTQHITYVLGKKGKSMDPITGTITSAVANVVTNPIPLGWWIAPIGALIALLFAYIFYRGMKKQDPGEPDMVRIAGYVKVGAMAYLKQQYKVVGIVFVILVILLSLMVFVFKTQSAWVPFAFLSGGFFSGLCGFLGMKTATEASSRTAFAAKTSLNKGLVVAFRSGAVMGLIVVGFGLIENYRTT